MTDRESPFSDANSGPVVPPTFGHAVPRQCTRWVGGGNCEKTPVVHVDWGESWGFCCEEHAKELGVVWLFQQKHEVGPDCGMPGSYWYPDENVCRCDGEIEPAVEVEREQVLV